MANANIEIWEQIYSRNEGFLSYPDDVFVRITHGLLDLHKHRTILDYGFGSGSNMIHLIKKGYELCGVEVSDSATAKLKERLRDLQLRADLRQIADGMIPFEGNSFDAVIAWQALYYNDWDSFYQAMREIDRVLRPGGVFLGTMAATGDYSHTHSYPLGDRIYRSTVPGQEGATVMVLEETDLERCFPGKKISKGQFYFHFRERHGKHWIVSYEK